MFSHLTVPSTQLQKQYEAVKEYERVKRTVNCEITVLKDISKRTQRGEVLVRRREWHSLAHIPSPQSLDCYH